MASTSLAAQLQRFATAQTSFLVEKKYRASILYDAKEAATIDNQTIFDRSRRGLEDLIVINPIFEQFGITLFDETTVNFQRSVETSTVNETLNKNIRKFLLHLSPHFLVRSAHECLEWLIRRYNINEFNIDDMMALILPYHETMMFVKCLQTIPLERSSWFWLKAIQKPGVPLSKQTLIQRAATDSAFLKFISKTTLAAVKELQLRAHLLQALFAFYSTITLGALHIADEISDSHVLNIAETLWKGLGSNVLDFCSASMIITSLLVTRVELEENFLKKIVERISEINHPDMRRESIVLLIIICQTQIDSSEMIVDIFLSKMVDTSLITATIGSLYKNNINVLSLCLPLITKCLRKAEDKTKAKNYQKFVKMLLAELYLNNDDAKVVIRCILNALKVPPKPQSDIIDLSDDDDDDDGDVDMLGNKKGQWHSSLMRTMETRYPEAFDAVKTYIMSNDDEESASLKIVLGSLLCSSYNADPSGATIFVDLYHPSAKNRQQAVENLVKMNKLSTMSVSDDKKNLLVAGIAQRLSDNNPDVVNEVLKFKTEDLIKIVGEQNLIKKLKLIIGDQFMTQQQWQRSVTSALEHITSKHLLSKENDVEIFLAIWPYMFPMNDIINRHKNTIKESGIVDKFPIIRKFVDLKYKDNQKSLMERVSKRLENSFDKSRIFEIVQYVRTIPDAEMTKMLAFHVVVLLTHSLPETVNHKLSSGVFEIVKKFSVQFELMNIDIDQYAHDLYNSRAERFPVQLIVQCTQSIIEKTNFSAVLDSEVIDFTCVTDELSLMLEIYRSLCNGLFSKSKTASRLYNTAMEQFIKKLKLPKIDRQIEFFSNFFISHHLNENLPNSIRIGVQLQIRSIRLFNALLEYTESLKEITTEVFIRIISGLTSPFEAVRALTCDTIDKLYELLDRSSQYSEFLGLLQNQREKILLSPEELSLFLFQSKRKRTTQLFEFIQKTDTPMILKATLLNILKLVDDEKHDTRYLKIVVDAALAILTKIDCTQPIILDPYESAVVHAAICRFNSDNISSISSPGNCRTFFEKALQHSNVLVQIDSRVRSISVETMRQNAFSNFKKLNTNLKKFIIESIVKSATFSKSNDVRTKASKFFQKSIELDGKIELDILTNMVKVTSSSDVAQTEPKKFISQELLQTSEWKCGVTLLEFLQKKRLDNPLDLMRQLFPILLKCSDFDDQSMIEYTKQLVLGDILNCCELMSPTGPFLETDFKVELIVLCVRSTQNPQTHHHALELLTKLATMIPEAVLHNIMPIFTFFGNSVVKRDDAYIYQLISNIIKSIVPILKHNNIIQVLKVFSDIILDVPAHRRPTLYEDLLKTLNAKKHLCTFLAILFDTDARNQKTDDPKQMNMRRTQIAIEITNLFDCDVIMETCYQLIKSLQSQLNDKRSKSDNDLNMIFNAANYSKNHILRYKYLILNFISILTNDKSTFWTRMSALDQQSLLKHQETFRNIIPAILKYIKASNPSVNKNAEKSSIGLSACYHILDHLLDLLYPDMLLKVVDTLLSEKNEVDIRIKIIDLLNKKLASPELFTGCKDSILLLLDPLTSIVNTVAEKPSELKLQEYALVAIHLSSKIAAKDCPEKFADLLKILAKILQSATSIRLRACLVQCLGELCANLRVNSISHLHRFMPAITDELNALTTSQTSAISPCILQAIYRIIESIGQFLSRHLINLITSLSILWSRLQETSSKDSQINLLKLDEIWQKLSSTLELRVLIPTVQEHVYPDLLKQGKFNAIGPLMVLLSDSFALSENSELVQYHQDLTTFFIDVIDFRSKFHHECKTIDEQEDFFIKTMIGFILKLSEGLFRPFYIKLHEWSNTRPSFNEHSYDRCITFYRFSNKVAESLKSLFNTFANPIIQSSADLLNKTFTNAEIVASSAKPATLIYNILSTLQTIFSYCPNYINSQRFNVLVEPLVNILDHDEYLEDESVIEILPKCFAQFAVAANNDLLWKQLNRQILSKTRSNSVEARRCALICSLAVVIQLGEDSIQLYPELIPSLSELLEDEDPEIQKLCNRGIIDIEKVTGEDLKKHL